MVSHSNEIIAQVLSMNDEQLSKFIAGLKLDTLEYLIAILEKAETRTFHKLVKYIESQ